MITNLNNFVNESLGSSFDITRARVGGASVIPLLSSLLFSVPPSRRKVLGAKPKQAGKKEGGWGEGIFARLLAVPVPFEQRKSGRGVWGEFRFSFAKSNWGQSRHLPEYLEGRTPQKNTLFIKRRRNRARAKWKEQRVFFCGVASLSSSGGAGFLIGGFAQKKFEHQSKNTANFQELLF